MKAKKKVAKKTAVKPRKPSAGAPDDAPPVCAAPACYEHVPDYGDRCAKHAPSEPHVVSAPATDEEIIATDNAVIREAHTKLSVRAPGHGSEDTDPSPLSDARHRPGAPTEPHVVSDAAITDYYEGRNASRRATGRTTDFSAPQACRQCGEPVEEARPCYAVPTCYACLPPPEPLPVLAVGPGKRAPALYVPPPLADPPVLPDLSGRTLEFHTPPGRRGQLGDVGFALLLDAGVVIWRTTDRLAGEVSYMLAAAGDLDDVQSGEITSRMWYPATDEQHAAIAAVDFETDLRAIAKSAGPAAEAFAEKLLAAEASIDEAIEHWGRLQVLAAEDTDNPAAQNRARLYGRTVESLVLEKQTGTPHCVDHLEPVPCKIHALAGRR